MSFDRFLWQLLLKSELIVIGCMQILFYFIRFSIFNLISFALKPFEFGLFFVCCNRICFAFKIIGILSPSKQFVATAATAAAMTIKIRNFDIFFLFITHNWISIQFYKITNCYDSPIDIWRQIDQVNIYLFLVKVNNYHNFLIITNYH